MLAGFFFSGFSSALDSAGFLSLLAIQTKIRIQGLKER
jgi:hypothetical protein